MFGARPIPPTNFMYLLRLSKVHFVVIQILALFSLQIPTKAHSNVPFRSKQWTLDKRVPGFGFEILFTKGFVSDPSPTALLRSRVRGF